MAQSVRRDGLDEVVLQGELSQNSGQVSRYHVQLVVRQIQSLQLPE